MTRSRQLLAFPGLLVLGLSACRSQAEAPPEVPVKRDPTVRESFAVYDEHNRLIRSPIEGLEAEIARRNAVGAAPLTDVYVISHGWNFTLGESGRLYENYALSLREALADIHREDPAFEPFFVFVTWSSVTRPLTEAVDSLLPLNLLPLARTLIECVDQFAFHIPSNWGETVDARHIALGTYARRTKWDPHTYSVDPSDSEYDHTRLRASERAKNASFEGYEISLSAILDRLIRMRIRHDFGLHVVGHSFGAKVASLAALDATARIEAARRVKAQGTLDWADSPRSLHGRVILDSLVMIEGALRLSEMYQPFDLPEFDDESSRTTSESSLASTPTAALAPLTTNLYRERSIPFESAASAIGRKAIVKTREDSATGWLFGFANFLLNYDALNGADFSESESFRFLDFTGIPLVIDAGEIVLRTVLTDTYAIVTQVPAAVGDVFTDSHDPLEFVSNVLFIPVAPIASLRAIGHQGLADGLIVDRFGLLPDEFKVTWMTESAIAYLDDHESYDEETFARMSSRIDASAAPPASPRYEEYDASSIYNGHIRDSAGFSRVARSLLNVVPPGAHSDVRSYDCVGGIRLRTRTFHWLYGITRVGAPVR